MLQERREQFTWCRPDVNTQYVSHHYLKSLWYNRIPESCVRVDILHFYLLSSFWRDSKSIGAFIHIAFTYQNFQSNDNSLELKKNPNRPPQDFSTDLRPNFSADIKISNFHPLPETQKGFLVQVMTLLHLASAADSTVWCYAAGERFWFQSVRLQDRLTESFARSWYYQPHAGPISITSQFFNSYDLQSHVYS